METQNHCCDNLSSTESKIIEMIANEMPNKEIASRLNYSQRTIEYYISILMGKFKVHTRVGLVDKAYKYHILKV
ncbi:helix-turn-helix transcriptional regulator [Priestia megaterium]|uniref:response regulator transcription factor n=1 Tax=Priestia TaxID=2800373 RepID=UPI001CFBAD4B|nr:MULTISPECIES: helix-turn-helix transcriptional regulator [Priestia]MED4219520.1 helix-turn-helix transcriptional regulator [Priestia megaterium]